ncbi:Fe-S protein assembly chaperone HscA [Endozoicomonadaceae bacterium StTr2]
MALLQISEPGLSPEPHARKRAVGIDLGTTNSLVATVREQGAETLPDLAGRHILPSIVHYGEAHQILVGHDARARVTEDPLNTLISVKRLMGRGKADVHTLDGVMPYNFADKEGMAAIQTRQGAVSPVEASASILKELSDRAQETLGGSLVGAVITVPAYFDDSQRQATRDAARLAGINVLRLLNEPTAAAVAYGLDQAEEGVIAVYDLGGGTFDISVLRISKGVFEVLATGGDTALGGDDFDQAVVGWVLEQAGVAANTLNASELRQLSLSGCAAKEALTTAETAEILFREKSYTLSRDSFNELVDPLVDRTLKACRRALRDAGLRADDVGEVVMVGGSTRVPRVRERVTELLGRKPHVDIDPDRVVAIGAAMQADILAGNKPADEMLLLDVIPLSLGLETMGGLMEKVIHRNTTIPVARAQEFTTFKDGQTAMSIHVLQGERELIQDNRSLARFSLRGIPPMPAGAAKIRVTFQVDADGLLSVRAQELSSGIESEVQVKPSYGLTDGEITRMLQESYTHAVDDKDLRALREQQVEADRILDALNVALEADGKALLSEQEFNGLLAEAEKLQLARNGADAGAIKQAIDATSKASDFFAARRMNSKIKTALSGHSVNEFENKAE